jgi:hypothetical protein
MTWGFFEIISPEAAEALRDYQDKTYGTKLDDPLILFEPGINKTVHYPTLEEIEKDMRKPIGEISPVKTRGIR